MVILNLAVVVYSLCVLKVIHIEEIYEMDKNLGIKGQSI